MKKLVIIATICLLIFTTAAAVQAAGDAKLNAVKGKVAIQPQGADAWKAATNGTSIKQGDEIKTAAGSSVIIKYSDGTMVKIAPLTTITVSGTTAANSNREITVASGKVSARVGKLKSGDSGFNVKTPTAVAGVRGTFFNTAAEGNATTIDVFEGEVEVANPDNPEQAVSVTANQTTSVQQGTAPAEPTTIPADRAAEGQAEFTESEFVSASFELKIEINPEVLKANEPATIAVTVLRNDEPFEQEVNLKLKLSGSAKFTDNGTNEIEVSTPGTGTIQLGLMSTVEESVTVDASMSLKIKQ